jgi:hypothetical protein
VPQNIERKPQESNLPQASRKKVSPQQNRSAATSNAKRNKRYTALPVSMSTVRSSNAKDMAGEGAVGGEGEGGGGGGEEGAPDADALAHLQTTVDPEVD